MAESTPEQEARDMLERMGVEGAQQFSAGDVAELANLLAWRQEVLRWQALGEVIAQETWKYSALFCFGGWWADRPWRVGNQ